jgi:hypothetical protein
MVCLHRGPAYGTVVGAMSTDANEGIAPRLARWMRGEVEPHEASLLATLMDGPRRREMGRLGMTAINEGRGGDAKAAFGLLTQIEPDIPVHRLMYAHACLIEDAPREAYVAFSESIALADPDGPHRGVAAEAWLGRADLMFRLGRVLDARADLCEALALAVDPVRRQALADHLKEFESMRLEGPQPVPASVEATASESAGRALTDAAVGPTPTGATRTDRGRS